IKYAFRPLIYPVLSAGIGDLYNPHVQTETHWISDCKRDMTAQFQLGRKYHIGDGVERDVETV
ncbi:sel1 repeat family protein, partial [Salmonella enterica subsp. enterica serovar Enteritidis]|uniref:SEL1-like repeat protein n=1 Tax=Salmonella enterica TaxID=28901 RepID=UPI001E571C22